MVLHGASFEIPARFSFQPYTAKWRLADAETVEWAEQPKLTKVMSRFVSPVTGPEKPLLRVRIGGPNLYGFALALEPSHTVLMHRASIPPDALQSHENCHNTPDVSCRPFQVLICQKPEFKEGLWSLKPGEVTKNALIMRDEFLNLKADPDLGWDWSVCQFLNKWGIWEPDKGYADDWESRPIAPLLSSPRDDRPDFVLVSPHAIKEQQEIYSKALLSSHRRSWLRSHHLSLNPVDDFPPFVVRASYCRQAIEATITIAHLTGLKFGICKRCGNVFEKENRHKKSYCSERCFNAAGVQRWREKQRKAAKMGAKRNAKG